LINSSEIGSLVRKTEAILKRREVYSTLADIAGEHHTQELIPRYTIENWLEKDFVKEKTLSEKLVLTAYALELVGIKLISSKLDTAQQVLSHAAKMFEYAGSYLDLPKLYSTNLLRHAAVCYDAGGYPCNSFVMAKRVLKELESTNKPMETIARFQFLMNLLIYSFLARKFNSMEELFQTIMAEKVSVQEVIKFIENEQEKAKEIIRLIGSLEVSDAINNFHQFLIDGEQVRLEKSCEAIDRAVQIFLDADDSENFALTTLLSAVMKEIQKRSVWRSVQKYFEQYPQYLKQLVMSDPPIVELWASQIEAIDNGLLDKEKKNFVISMPTSAGKTLIAELAIAKCLFENPDLSCIYVAPNKALALQVERNLRKRIATLGFKVSLVVGAYDHPEIETLKLKKCRVLITTPEKLSLLLKARHSIVSSCGLFVFDEAQTLHTGRDRGIHMEFLLIRIRKLMPRSQVILLSAVISNPYELASWMGGSKTQAVSIDWHPTRTLQAVLHDGVVEYYDEMRGLRFEFPEAKGKPNIEKAVILARAYQTFGPVLIFCNTKARAEEIAKRLSEGKFISPPEDSLPKLKQLATRVRAQFGSDFALSKFIEKGICYHHANLSSEIRSEIEELVRTGDIQFVASTTTLAEGINTPVSTVIIPYLNFQEFIRKGRFKWISLTKMLYKNIAGRAGRALENTEGHVVLIKQEGKPLSDTIEYISSSRAELEPIRSALEELSQTKLTQRIDFTDKNVLAYQTEILSTICDQILQTDEIGTLIDLTLFGHFVSRESEQYQKLMKHTSMQLQYLCERNALTHSSPYKPTDLGEIYNQTGLSPKSCELLLNRIESLKKKGFNFKIPVDPNTPFFHKQLVELLSLAFIPLEVRSSDTFKPNLPNAEILLDWIFGKGVIEIAKDYFRAKDFDKAVLEAFAYSYVQLSYYVPWVLWAVTRLFDFKGIAYSWPVKLLPAFAKYGTSDIVATYCSGLGVSSRKAAAMLANKYRKEKRRIKFEVVLDWLFSLRREDITAIIINESLQDSVFSDIQKSKKSLSPFLHT
jgi:helicase